MCGILVVLCKKDKMNAISLLIKSLGLLQNRGYDSFGSSSIIKNNNIIEYSIYKTACTDKSINFDTFKTNIYNIKTNNTIGHTRWATHGIISHENAHPHISNSKKIVLVHNGIIENYKNIKNFLLKHKYTFYSETDSEVIVNLIDYHYTKCKDIKLAINESILQLSGTYGLAIQCIDYPDNTYIIRNGSPILVGENDEYIIATSEKTGFINQVRQFYVIDNNDLITLSRTNGIITKNTYDKIKCNYEIISLTSEPYEHWTLKEINEQSTSLNKTINNGSRIDNDNIKLGGVENILPMINEINNIILLGCGTSLHACQIGEYYFKKYRCVNNINHYDAGEFSLEDIPPQNKTLIIMCSQSGETMDLHKILDVIKYKSNCITLGIINVVDSLIARETDCGIYINVGKEVAVASTKSFTSSLTILYLLSIWFYQHRKENIKHIDIICQNIRNVIENVNTINNNINTILNNSYINMLNVENIFILGKNKYQYIAKEMALKLKEICYIHAEGYSGSSLKHGSFALLTKNFPVILLIDEQNQSKMMNTYKEIESRGVYILVISEIENLSVKNIIKIPKVYELQEILYMIVLQHIAYKLSILRDINPDKPKNLAKVVTVE